MPTSKKNTQKEYKCTYHKNKNGMGGVAVGDNIEIYIDQSQENFALDNDIVNVAIYDESTNDLQGQITSIVTHNTKKLIGFVQQHQPKSILRVTDAKFGRYLVYINPHDKNIKRDEIVNTVISAYPSKDSPFFVVDLSDVIGEENDDNIFIEKLLEKSNIAVEFSLNAIKEAQDLPDHVLPHEIKDRLDLRGLPFVTIDGEDAKDFDDAVFAEMHDNIFTLYVAIADVANYVKSNSPLDEDAFTRGTSVYFPNRVVPMLPESISNGLCSLKPNVDRLSMCCQMDITLDGDIIGYKVYNAVIHSQARLTYNQVQNWLNDLSLTPANLVSNISTLYLVFEALLKSRVKRGAIDFDTTEAIFNFADNGEILELIPKVRLDSHRLIEECMLAANVSVADFLVKANHPTLFRIHEKPSLVKFTALKDYLNSLAIKFDVKYENLTPRDYTNLLESIRDHNDFATIQTSVLRSMQLAIYSPNNIGHFGLSYKQYLHFTSPIRRYPDLLVHRAAKAVINNTSYNYSEPLVKLGEHTSSTEQISVEVERKVDAYYKCKYARNNIGKSYDGIISSIVNFGIFVYIPQIMIEGLIHVSEIGEDYFVLDEKSMSLIGKKSGIRYKAGQLLHVEIVGVNMAKLFIDLKIIV